MIRAQWPHPRGRLVQAQSRLYAVLRLDEGQCKKARAY